MFSVLYPNVDEILGLVVYYGGFYATIPPESYSTVLEKVASHGFIVLAPWTPTGTIEWVEEYLETIDWVCKGLLIIK